MEFTFNLGLWGAALLIVGAVVLGVALYLFGTAHLGYEWLATAIAGVIGGFVASEFIVGFRTWEPVVDGLALVPALIGGLIVGVVVAGAARFLTGGTIDMRSPA